MSAKLKDIMTGFYVKLKPFPPKKEIIPGIKVPEGLLIVSDIIIHVYLCPKVSHASEWASLVQMEIPSLLESQLSAAWPKICFFLKAH